MVRAKVRLLLGLLPPFNCAARVIVKVRVRPFIWAWDMCQIERGTCLKPSKCGRAGGSSCFGYKGRFRGRLGCG